MTWASPWAGLLAAGIILPLIAHLWSRRQPPTVGFPSLRFLRASSPVSRRLQTVRDWPLLIVRALVVLLVAAAAAGPTVGERTRGGARPVHRIIVIDEAVGAEVVADVTRASSDAAATVEALGPGAIASLVAEATERARLAPPHRRSEIVLVWDGARHALDERDLAAIPPHIGVRLVTVDGPATSRAVPASTLPLVLEPTPADRTVAAALRQGLASVRVPPAPTTVHIIWPPAPQGSVPALGRLPPRLTRAMDDLAADSRVQEAAERSVRDPRAPRADGPAPGRWVARTATMAPLLRTWVADDRLVVASDATPASPLSWWAAVAALEGQVRWERLAPSPERWAPEALRAAAREPASAPGIVAPAGRETRAAWVVILLLLLGEQWWRHRLQGREATNAA